MLASFLLSLREGLEAALILGIILGILRRTHQTHLSASIWRGAGAAILFSLMTGIILNLAGAEFEGHGEVIFEGATMLVAAGLLTWMVFWMQKQARSRKTSIEQEVLKATQRGGQRALFLVAFLAIVREGVELSVFLLAAGMASTSVDIALGSLLGLVTAATLGWMAFHTTRRMHVGGVFRATNLLLALFAAGLVAHGVHEFIEIGWIPTIVPQVWNLNQFLPIQSTIGSLLASVFGYNSTPSLSEMVAYLGYFVLLLAGWRFFETRPIHVRGKSEA